MAIIRILLSCFFFLLCNVPASGQQKYPSTLLWKISGKNLIQPSYLFGTMHVQDRRLFYFGDSLYAALETTEGFAMEINPDEMMDSLFRSLGKKDTSALLKNILNEAAYKRIAKKLEKKFKIPADKITAKKLAEERRRINNIEQKKDDMPTIMDLYLFSIARRQGKYTGGIEDLADQFEIADEIGNINLDDFVKDDSVLRKMYLERMIKIYVNKDLTGLNEMINGVLNNEFRDILLIKRNRKMAMRMDSLSHVRTTFFAIGAAHLPGDSGVITLLQQMGYQVEPVLSARNIAPEDYKYTAKELTWLKVEDENKMCSVDMPGVPSDVMAQETLPMKMYMDLAELNVYGIAVTPVSEEEAKSDSLFDRLIENYKKTSFEIKSIKNITYKNCRGIEMLAIQDDDTEFRYRLLVKGNKLFIIIFGGKNKDNLYGLNAEKFLGSLTFNDENIEGKKQWQLFVNEKNAFSMMAPGNTIESKAKDQEGSEYDQFTSVDYSDGNYYMVVIRDTKAGYFIESDSLYFDEYKKSLNNLTGYNVKEFSVVKFKNYNACHFTAVQITGGQEILIEGYLIRRGSRTYVPMVVMPREKADFPGITNFFRSFTPLPFKKTDWKRYNLGNSAVSTLAPGAFIKMEEDSTAYAYNSKIQKYLVQDINTAESYTAEIETLSLNYWSNSDSLFFKSRINAFKAGTDSIISSQIIKGPFMGREVLLQMSNTAVFKKLKVFLNGDTVYTFYTFQHGEGLKGEREKSFFSEIQFPKGYPTSIFSNKAVQLLKSLQSTDSSVVAEARNVLDLVELSKNDLPDLYAALPKKYKKFENDYRTVNELLKDEIIELNDSSVVAFAEKLYGIKNDSTEDVQMLILEMLARHKTAVSYSLLKQFLLKEAPGKGNIYNLINAVTDTLSLIKDFFPAATVLYADTVTGGGIARLANELLDSNWVAASAVLQNENALYLLAEKQYNEIKKDKESFPAYNAEVIVLLGRFNTVQSNALLNKFLSLPDMWVKNNAILALLKNNQAVSETVIKKFAADKEWRTGFYESLKLIKKTSLFPAGFYSQLKFAESYLYNSLIEDYEVDVKSMQFIKEKTAFIKGKMQRFYIYKIMCNDEEDITPRFAVCGAFDMDKNKAEIKEDEQDIFLNYEDAYSLPDIDKLFSKYIDEKIKNSKVN